MDAMRDGGPVNIPLTLKFKGGRDYLQGPDIYNAVNQAIRKVMGNSFFVSHIEYRSFARRQIDVCILADDHEVTGDQMGRFKAMNKSGQMIGGILVQSDRDICGRYDYHEEKIISRSVWGDASISQLERGGYSSIEEIVALTKALHYKLLPSVKKWVFVQLALTRPLKETADSYSIALKQNLGGRYTRSSIVEDGVEIGWIGFSLS
ncbi:MAG: hypothetical protein D6694_00610 [Gammaproteobacteria bacterium]|nr:MAG: hypothetical protein D6694_00610 [Gammaproteobacteria bacterium]